MPCARIGAPQLQATATAPMYLAKPSTPVQASLYRVERTESVTQLRQYTEQRRAEDAHTNCITPHSAVKRNRKRKNLDTPGPTNFPKINFSSHIEVFTQKHVLCEHASSCFYASYIIPGHLY